MNLQVDNKYKIIVLEALDDYLYKVSLKLNELKGQTMTKERKQLTEKQRLGEELRNQLLADKHD
jgi:hypothetical protein